MQNKAAGRLKATVALAQDFQKRKIPIHGLGIQLHTGIWLDTTSLGNALRQMAATGLLIHISELDVRVIGKSTAVLLTEELKQKQGEMYANIVSCYLRNVPKKQQYGITMWNVTDNDNRLAKDANGV